MKDCGFKHSYGKLLTVAPCRALFYKTFTFLVRCIKKRIDLLKKRYNRFLQSLIIHCKFITIMQQ
ncbi:hypothetical protein HMPREF9554_02544 [Treponema phagedenis F0421]|nr:hypothetical protein HMPREF9554_02544 [Treponema phagedenis F0421]